MTPAVSEIDPEYVKLQYLYVPWTDKLDSFGVGKALARHVANHFRARLTIVCPQKSNAQYHAELAKLPIVTERTGIVADVGVVLAFVPTRKVMATEVHRRSKSIVIMVEDPSERFEAWARLVGAYNVLTRKVMSAGLSEAGTKALDCVVSEGYNGWHDSIAEMMTTKHLKDLAELGEYDRAIVIEFADQRKGEHALKRLEKILDRFERAVPAVA